jgi:hypothetical protein
MLRRRRGCLDRKAGVIAHGGEPQLTVIKLILRAVTGA